MSHIQDFPREILFTIFSFFTEGRTLALTSLACKRFYQLAKEKVLWKSLCLSKTAHPRLEAFRNDWKEYYINKLYPMIDPWHQVAVLSEHNSSLSIINPSFPTHSPKVISYHSIGSMRYMCWSPISDLVATSEFEPVSAEAKILIFDRYGKKSTFHTPSLSFHMHWHKDSTRLAYLCCPPTRPIILLSQLDVLTGTTSVLEEGRPLFFTCSPIPGDTRIVAHVSLSSLRILSTCGGDNIELVVHGYSQGRYTVPVWTPNNKILCVLVGPIDKQCLVSIDVSHLKEVKNDYSSTEKVYGSRTLTKVPVVVEKTIYSWSTSLGYRSYLDFQLSPNGQFIAFSCSSRELWLYRFTNDNEPREANELPNPKLLWTYKPQESSLAVCCFLFSPNSKYLLSLHRSSFAPHYKWHLYDCETFETTAFNHVFLQCDFFHSSIIPNFSQFFTGMTLFSPDSKSFIYPSGSSIFIQSIDQKKAVRVCEGWFPSWSFY